MKVTRAGLNAALWKTILIVPLAWLLGMVFIFALIATTQRPGWRPIASVLSAPQAEGYFAAAGILGACAGLIAAAWMTAGLIILMASFLVDAAAYWQGRKAA